MTNNERFNAMLNSCENPRAVSGITLTVLHSYLQMIRGEVLA